MNKAVFLPPQNFVQRFTSGLVQRPVLSFVIFWGLLNLLQVALMELTSDEGYYWFYSQHLQWGYYDHPPMIALLIKLGSAMLPGELGVRAFNVLLSTAGLALFFTLLPDAYKKSNRTYLVLLSAPLLHYLTFLLFPDGPLLFFSLVFLLLYKRFLAKETLTIAVLLGVSLSLMAYSKYHGALVLFFTVLANPRLLRSGYFYLSLFVAALLFLPHLWWQYTQDFPTLKYHLSGRTGQLSLRHVGEYLSQQAVAIGPGLIFIPFVSKTTNVFERTLKFIIIGTFIFFLVSSVKTFVHFHWTSIALYPLLYFAVRYYHEPKTKALFRWLILPFAVLFFVARVLLMLPLVENMHVGEDYYHGRKAWAKEIASLAGNRTVFMPNNLREASLYSYYSGKEGVTLYTRPEKKSQYELWGYEDSLQGKDVLFINKHPFHKSVELMTVMGQKVHYAAVPFFQSFYSGITINATVTQGTDTTLTADVEIINHRTTPLDLSRESSGERTSLVVAFEKKREIVHTPVVYAFTPADSVPPGGRIRRRVSIPIGGLQSTGYDLYFGIRAGLLPDAMLSTGLPFDKKP